MIQLNKEGGTAEFGLQLSHIGRNSDALMVLLYMVLLKLEPYKLHSFLLDCWKLLLQEL